MSESIDQDIDDLIKRLHEVTPSGHSTDVRLKCWLGFHGGVPIDVIKEDLTKYVEYCEEEFNYDS